MFVLSIAIWFYQVRFHKFNSLVLVTGKAFKTVPPYGCGLQVLTIWLHGGCN